MRTDASGEVGDLRMQLYTDCLDLDRPGYVAGYISITESPLDSKLQVPSTL